MRKLMRLFWIQERGNAAAEMGLVITLFLLLLGGAMEFGIVIFQIMEVNNAVEAGAGYASANAGNCTAPTCGTSTCTPGACNAAYTTAIKNVIQGSTGLSSNVTASTPTVKCGCPSNSGVTLSTSSCPKPCVTGGPNPGTYVVVNGSYSLLTNTIPFLPNNGSILPSSINFTYTVRVQ